jgi:hypothetical protein
MASNKDFPESLYAIVDPDVRSSIHRTLAGALKVDKDILPKLIADAPADCYSGYVGWKINSSNVGAIS